MGSAALSLLDELLQLWPLPEQGGKLLTSDTPRVRSGHPFWSFLILSAFSSSCDNLWLCYFLDLAKWTKRTPTFPNKQILCPCPSHVLAGYELVKVLATNSQLCKCKRLSWMGALPCVSKSATSSMQCWAVHCRVTSWHVFGPLGRHINLMLLTTVTWHSLKVKSSMWKKTGQEIQQTCWTNLSNASNWIQSLALPLYSFNVLSPIVTMPTYSWISWQASHLQHIIWETLLVHLFLLRRTLPFLRFLVGTDQESYFNQNISEYNMLRFATVCYHHVLCKKTRLASAGRMGPLEPRNLSAVSKSL